MVTSTFNSGWKVRVTPNCPHTELPAFSWKPPSCLITADSIECQVGLQWSAGTLCPSQPASQVSWEFAQKCVAWILSLWFASYLHSLWVFSMPCRGGAALHSSGLKHKMHILKSIHFARRFSTCLAEMFLSSATVLWITSNVAVFLCSNIQNPSCHMCLCICLAWPESDSSFWLFRTIWWFDTNWPFFPFFF